MENIHTGNKIDFKEAFGYAWGVIKKEWGFLLLLSFVTFMISLPFGILDSVWQGLLTDMLGEGETFFDILNYISTQELAWYAFFRTLFFILTLILAYNTQKIYLNILHGKSGEVKDLFKFPTSNIFRYYGAIIVYIVMIVAGLIALIVPGFYFLFKYLFTSTLVIDKNMGILEAARKSAKMMEGNKWKMAEFTVMMVVTMIGIIIAGLICLLIGVIPAFFIVSWTCTFANLHVYKKLAA